MKPARATKSSVPFLVLTIVFLASATAVPPPGPVISQIQRQSTLDRDLVTAERGHPLLRGYGRAIFLHQISWAGTTSFEMTYEWLPSSDCLGSSCYESLIVYLGKDKRVHQLNLRPVGYNSNRLSVKSGAKCLRRFRRFLKTSNKTSELGKGTRARMFVTLVCHKSPGDFPHIILSSDDVRGDETNLSPDQKSCLKKLKKDEVLHSGRYFLVCAYGEQIKGTVTDPHAAQAYWTPMVLYEFSMTERGRINSVEIRVLNKPAAPSSK